MKIEPLFKLGNAAAKLILRHVFKDVEIVKDFALDISDIIGLVAADNLSQRKAVRQFEQIAEKIAETLLPLFDAEKIRLDEGELYAVVAAANSALDKASVTADSVVVQNLDPSILQKFVLELGQSGTRDLSEAGHAFYERIISESTHRMHVRQPASNLAEISPL